MLNLNGTKSEERCYSALINKSTITASEHQIQVSNSQVSVLSQSTKLELPLWLSKGLYEKKRRVLSIELPKVYREGWRTVFNADPNVVDLHKMGPYYYGLGSQMLHFDSPENPEIGQTLLQVKRYARTHTHRYVKILTITFPSP